MGNSGVTLHYDGWTAQPLERTQVLDLQHLRRIEAAMQDRVSWSSSAQSDQPEALPPGWHWCWFADTFPAAELGRDGHPQRGGFLPPVELPRRMWAGGKLAFHRPLFTGESATRLSEVIAIEQKNGRSGELVFVSLRHRLSQRGELALEETQDLVFREDPSPDAPRIEPPQAPCDAQFSRKVEPDPVWLFRYSAVTFNGHRIHYDHDYARQVEGYPSIVVHAPLIATLLADLAREASGSPALREFSFRAVSPLFCGETFTINARRKADTMVLWAAGPGGQLAMQAKAQF